MICYRDSEKMEPDFKTYDPEDEHTYCFFMDYNEVTDWNEALGLPRNFRGQWGSGISSKLESYESFNFIYLNVLDKADVFGKMRSNCIYFNDHLIVFVSNDTQIMAEQLFDPASEADWKNANVQKLLLCYFESLLTDDTQMVQDVEQMVLELEECLMYKDQRDFIDEIMGFRKCVMLLKRYYEQLLDVAMNMEENEAFTVDKQLRAQYRVFRIKVNRLLDNVVNLRDYVNHVFDAYQTNLDLNLNTVMKFFTVVATIFLPLTLITSWYGMNLNMPEFDWQYGYLIAIFLCAFIVIFCIRLFKRKGWF